MTRDDWKEVEKLLRKEDVQFVMRARCEEQGHDWANGITAGFQFVQVCKWCGGYDR